MPIVGYFLLGLFSMLILLALLGNLLVTAAIIYDRHLRRSPENLFLVSLAISDLLVSVLVMVFAATNDLLGYWPFGQGYCQFWICFDITCCTASILNLCAISLDRYWHISRPMVYVRYCNRRRIYYCIVIVWFISALIGAAPLGFGFGSRVDNSTPQPQCEMKLPLAYAIGSSLLSFFLPAAVMVLLYTKLYLYARRHVRSIKTQLHQATSFLIMQLASEKIRELRLSRWEKMSRHLPGGNRNAATALSADSQANGQHKHQSVNDQKARLTLGVIMGTFLFCWLPFFLVNIARSAVPHTIPQTLILAVTWLGYANSAANPVIYSIFNRDFRVAFGKIIVDTFVCCERSKKRNEKSINRTPGDERRRSTRSSDAPGAENNNTAAGNGGGMLTAGNAVATRLVAINNNESSCVLQDRE